MTAEVLQQIFSTRSKQELFTLVPSLPEAITQLSPEQQREMQSFFGKEVDLVDHELRLAQYILIFVLSDQHLRQEISEVVDFSYIPPALLVTIPQLAADFEQAGLGREFQQFMKQLG